MSEFESKIQDLNKRKTEIIQQLEFIRSNFITASIPFAKDWIKDRVESNVIEDTKRTKQLHEENKLSEMKSELKKILDDMPQIINEYLNNDNCWKHTNINNIPKDMRDRSESLSSDKIREMINNGLRYVFGYAGKLLIEFDYQNSQSSDPYGEWKNEGSVPKYGYGIRWTDNLNEIYKEYHDNVKKLVETDKELKSLNKQKEENESSNLWNNA